MKFKIKAVTGEGAKVTFPREAETRESLLRQLRSEGYVVVSAEEDGSEEGEAIPADAPFWHPAWLKRPGKFEIEMSLRQLSAMLKSGITLLAAVKTAAAQSLTPRLSRIWRETAECVCRGETFTAALEKNRRVFGEVAIRLAEAGEKSGELDKTLARAADQMASRRELKTAVVNALLYPFVAIAMSIGVSSYLVGAVIPKIADFLRAGDVELPAVTQMLVDASDFIRLEWPSIAAWIAAAALCWFLAGLNPYGKDAEDALLMKIPVTGRILRISGTALFSKSMQIMLESGVPLVDSLESSARILGNRRLRRRASEMTGGITRGETLTSAMGNSKEFMPMLRAMVATGETSGALYEAFGETAAFHELMLSLAVKRFGMLIEPVMIAATGAIVGFVYVAFFTAMFAIAGAS